MPDLTDMACEYTVYSGGKRSWLRAVSIPVAESLEELESQTFRKRVDLPSYLEIESRITNDSGLAIAGVIGVFAFFASWLSAKVLDDIWETKFQPAFRKALGDADSKLPDAGDPVPKMLQIGISYADKQVFFLVALIGDTFDDILISSESTLKAVHRNAIAWVEENGAKSPVHVYVVNRGKMNLEPHCFDNLILAHRYLDTMQVTKPTG